MRDELKAKVFRYAKLNHDALLEAYSIRNDGTQNTINGMRKAIREHGLTEQQLAEFFNQEERNQIRKTWEADRGIRCFNQDV